MSKFKIGDCVVIKRRWDKAQRPCTVMDTDGDLVFARCYGREYQLAEHMFKACPRRQSR